MEYLDMNYSSMNRLKGRCYDNDDSAMQSIISEIIRLNGYRTLARWSPKSDKESKNSSEMIQEGQGMLAGCFQRLNLDLLSETLSEPDTLKSCNGKFPRGFFKFVKRGFLRFLAV